MAVTCSATRPKFLVTECVQVGDDGACWARGISHELFGSECCHDLVRKEVVKEVAGNFDRYQEAFSSDQLEDPEHMRADGKPLTMEDYMLKMSQPHTWGGEVEISAAAVAFDACITVYWLEKNGTSRKEVATEAFSYGNPNSKRQAKLGYKHGHYWVIKVGHSLTFACM